MEDKYTELRAALEAGPTPGPRRVSDDGLRVLDDTGGELLSRRPDGCSTLHTEHGAQQRANVMLAAAAGPGTICDLLAERDALREALWAATEHNALHFGESHNTVIHGRAALAQEQGEKHDNQS